MSFGFSVGDFLAVSQLAFTLYRQYYLVEHGAPQEFQSLVAELTTLSTSLQMLQNEVADENSVLIQSGEDRLKMMEMINRVEGTLKQLEELAEKYAKLYDPGTLKIKEVWDRVRWSADMADIDGLRNELVYHNGSIYLLLTSAGNSSLQRLETTNIKIERAVSSIRDRIDKIQLPSSTPSPTPSPQRNHDDLPPILSGPATTKGTALLRCDFSAILMKNAETTIPWKAIGIKDWISAGRWWLLKYQHQMQHGLGSGNVVPHTIYKSLIKAYWILSDVITKHPQLSHLEAGIQFDVQALAEEIDEEFKNIDSKKLQVPRLADLDRSELHIWEKQVVGTTEDISHSPGEQSSDETLRLPHNPAFELLFKTFGFYQHSNGLRIPCFIQLFAHQYEKVIRLHMYDQSGNLQAELAVDPSTRSTMHCKDGGIFIDGQWVIIGREEAIFLHLIFAALVEYVWWYRRTSEPKSIRSCYIQSFCMIFAVAFKYMQFVDNLENINLENINHIFRYAPKLCNSGVDHFGLVKSSGTALQKQALLGDKEYLQVRVQLESKGEFLLPWVEYTHLSVTNQLVIRLQYAKTHHIVQAKQKELENMAMGYWKHYSKYLEARWKPVMQFDSRVAGIVLAFMGGSLYGADVEQDALGLINSDKDGNLCWRDRGPGVDFSLGSALIAAAACGDWRLVELLRLIEVETGIILLQGDVANRALWEASAGGHETAVKVLMDVGANVDAETVKGSERTALQAAVVHGHEAVVKLLVDKSADVNARVSGRTALQAAAKHGHDDIVELLIDEGADVNVAAVGMSGRTALQMAAEHGHEDIVELLIDRGADVNAEASWRSGRTALQAAAEYGHEDIVKLLIDKDADVNAEAARDFGRTALQAAAGHGHEDIVELLIDRGADVNAEALWRSGRTALQAAAEYGHEDIVKLLMDQGADVNAAAAGDSGRTALQAAAEHRHEDIVKLLIDKGADVNAAAAIYSGRTALQAAAGHGHEDIVKLLIDKGADVNAEAAWNRGRAALQAAAEHGHGDIAKLLIVKGANVNAAAAERFGRTALQAAAEHGHGDIAKLLIVKGANVNAAAAEWNGRTALQAAAEHGHEDIAKLLIDEGADVNAAAARYGKTALKAAVEHGHEGIVKLLIDRGVDVNARSSGRTALQEAAVHGHEDIRKLLIDKGAM